MTNSKSPRNFHSWMSAWALIIPLLIQDLTIITDYSIMSGTKFSTIWVLGEKIFLFALARHFELFKLLLAYLLLLLLNKAFMISPILSQFLPCYIYSIFLILIHIKLKWLSGLLDLEHGYRSWEVALRYG